MEQTENQKKAWEDSDNAPFLKILKENKGENIIENFTPEQKELWENAYDPNQEKDKVLICADERVMPRAGEFKIGTAGQLILDSKEYRDNFISSFKGKIKTVRSHSGCGAAGIAYSNLNEEEKHKFIGLANELKLQELTNKEVGQSDIYGAYYSYDLSKSLEAGFEHDFFPNMRGYQEFHDARIIFWSADPTFDPSTLADNFLPAHFLSNGLAFGVHEDYCKEELKVLSGIALGDHGFGTSINDNTPFYVVCVGKNLEEATKMRGLAIDILKEYGNRVDVKILSKA